MTNTSILPSFYVHPDYLIFEQVLDEIGKAICKGWDGNCIKASKIYSELYVTENAMKREVRRTQIYCPTPEQEAALRKHLNDFKETGNIQKREFLINIAFLNDRLKRPYQDIESLARASDFEVMAERLTLLINLTHDTEETNLRNLLNLTQVKIKLRDALCVGTLNSYVSKDKEYETLPAIFWSNEKQWSRLQIEGFIKDGKKQLSGRVFFKKEDVTKFLASISPSKLKKNKNFQRKNDEWDKFCDQRPWFDIARSAFFKFGMEGIENMENIKPLTNYIGKQAQEKKLKVPELKISERKINSLATFLRAELQGEGNSYKAKNKPKKIKPSLKK